MSALAIFGIDVADLVADLLRALLDLLVPDVASRWGSRVAAWLVALPNVTDPRQFDQLNAFRTSLTHAAWGLLSLSLVVGALQYWVAGFTDGSRASALDAVRRAALAAGALIAYPTLVAQLVLAVNHLTAALIRHPRAVEGLDVLLGGALALGAISGGLSLGLGLAAVLAVVFFLAALVVMKIALTALLCVLLVGGGIVIALYPLPQGEGLVRLWLAGLTCALIVPVTWALIFAVAGLVGRDALTASGGLGGGLEALVKPFVAVACLYLAYRAPSLLAAQARMLGLRFDVAGGMRSSPGEGRLRSVAARQGGAYASRFAGLGAAAARPASAVAGRVGGAARRQTLNAGHAARRAAARGAVNLEAAGGPGARMATVVAAAGSAVRTAGRAGSAGSRAAASGNDWWRQAGHGSSKAPGATRSAPSGEPPAGPARDRRSVSLGPSGVVRRGPVAAGARSVAGMDRRSMSVRRVADTTGRGAPQSLGSLRESGGGRHGSPSYVHFVQPLPSRHRPATAPSTRRSAE